MGAIQGKYLYLGKYYRDTCTGRTTRVSAPRMWARPTVSVCVVNEAELNVKFITMWQVAALTITNYVFLCNAVDHHYKHRQMANTLPGGTTVHNKH